MKSKSGRDGQCRIVFAPIGLIQDLKGAFGVRRLVAALEIVSWPGNGSLLPFSGETNAWLRAHRGNPGSKLPVWSSTMLLKAATSRRTPNASWARAMGQKLCGMARGARAPFCSAKTAFCLTLRRHCTYKKHASMLVLHVLSPYPGMADPYRSERSREGAAMVCRPLMGMIFAHGFPRRAQHDPVGRW
jgi:hypothetical protein